MISFGISLSMHQIALLQMVASTTEAAQKWAAEYKESGIYKDSPQMSSPRVSRHWVTTVRVPMSEGLINWVKIDPRYNYGYWEITQKGLLILEIISLDIQEAAVQLSGLIPAKPQKGKGRQQEMFSERK